MIVSVIRCIYVRVRWIGLLYFLAHTSCYVGNVFFTSLHILHVTLDTSSLLRCTHFMLRWIRLLYFVAHTSCNVGNVFSTSLHIHQGTLDTSSLLPCRAFNMSLLTTPSANLQKMAFPARKPKGACPHWDNR